MLHLHLSIFLTYIAALLPYANAIVSHKDLFGYGLQNGDSELPKIYPADGPRISLNFVELDPKFTLFGKSANLFAVRDDGTFIIRDAAPSGFVGEIRVFSANVDLRKCGSVFWRKSTSNTDLNKAQDEIGLAFPAYNGTLKYAVIATWYQVSPGRRTLQTWFDKSDSTGNTSTFQGILTTDGHHSFVIFNYNQIGFVKSNGRSGTVGFSVPGSTYDYTGSRISYMAIESNADKSGRWVYRVDQGTIYEPSSVCPIPPQPDNGSCMAEDYTPESVAHCTCKDGFQSYTLDAKLKCSRKADNKTVHWTENVPVCTTLIQTTAESPQPSADPSDSPLSETNRRNKSLPINEGELYAICFTVASVYLLLVYLWALCVNNSEQWKRIQFNFAGVAVALSGLFLVKVIIFLITSTFKLFERTFYARKEWCLSLRFLYGSCDVPANCHASLQFVSRIRNEYNAYDNCSKSSRITFNILPFGLALLFIALIVFHSLCFFAFAKVAYEGARRPRRCRQCGGWHCQSCAPRQYV